MKTSLKKTSCCNIVEGAIKAVEFLFLRTSVYSLFYFKCRYPRRDGNLQRRFFVQNNYGGCQNDAGWFLVVEKDSCDWERKTTRPFFLYSGLTGRDLQDSEYYSWFIPFISFNFDNWDACNNSDWILIWISICISHWGMFEKIERIFPDMVIADLFLISVGKSIKAYLWIQRIRYIRAYYT